MKLEVLRLYERIGYSTIIHKFGYRFDDSEWMLVCGKFESTGKIVYQVNNINGFMISREIPELHKMSEEELFQLSVVEDYKIDVQYLVSFMKDADEAYSINDYSTKLLEIDIE